MSGIVSGVMKNVRFNQDDTGFLGVITAGFETPPYYPDIQATYMLQPYGEMSYFHENTRTVCISHGATYFNVGVVDNREIARTLDIKAGEKALFSDTYKLILKNNEILAQWAENNATLASGEDLQEAIRVQCETNLAIYNTLLAIQVAYSTHTHPGVTKGKESTETTTQQFQIDPTLSAQWVPLTNQVLTDVTADKYLVADSGLSPIEYGV